MIEAGGHTHRWELHPCLTLCQQPAALIPRWGQGPRPTPTELDGGDPLQEDQGTAGEAGREGLS